MVSFISQRTGSGSLISTPSITWTYHISTIGSVFRFRGKKGGQFVGMSPCHRLPPVLQSISKVEFLPPPVLLLSCFCIFSRVLVWFWQLWTCLTSDLHGSIHRPSLLSLMDSIINYLVPIDTLLADLLTAVKVDSRDIYLSTEARPYQPRPPDKPKHLDQLNSLTRIRSCPTTMIDPQQKSWTLHGHLLILEDLDYRASYIFPSSATLVGF